MVSISEFKKVIRFEFVVKTDNTSGGKKEDFIHYIETRAKVKKRDGFRSFQEGKDKIINVYDVECFWRHAIETNLTKDTRVIYENRNFRIETYEIIRETRAFYRFTMSEEL